MFFVIDKSKILSYVIAICTVVILFVAATGLNNNSDYFNLRIYSENSRIEFNYSFSFINGFLNLDVQEVIF